MARQPKKREPRKPLTSVSESDRYPDTPLSGAGVGTGVAELLERLASIATPEEPPDPIEWLEATRRLSPESSKETGPFRFERAHYLEEPQRAILGPATPEVVIDWASQCGKTELELNALLYWSRWAPAPALAVAPDWKSAKSLSADRVRPMMRDARFSYSEEESREDEFKDDSAFRMTLGSRMPLTIVHASSATALAQRPVKYLIFDETSRMPLQARGRAAEGDPIALARVRLTTWGDEAKVLYTSSPVELAECRITTLFEDSTREKWHSRCPGCRHLQILRLAEMDFASVKARCLHCGRTYTQGQWQGLKGKWIAENPGHSRRGFWLNGFASPFVRWEVIFSEWRTACHAKEEGDYSLFRVVLGTRLAENFTVKVQLMSEPEILLARRKKYEVPEQARIVLGAIDTQKHWLEYLVAAVGTRNEIWCLETGTIPGRIADDAERIYTELDSQVLNRTWSRPDGTTLSLSRCLQDSGGHATAEVHRRCNLRAHLLWPYRGSPDLTGPWKRGTDNLTHARLIQGNANYFKEQLATKLEIVTPGPGYIHFGSEEAGFDEEFFLQLLSERKESKMRNGVRSTRWVPIRERNEALDLVCMILCCIETYRGQIDGIRQPATKEGRERPEHALAFGVMPPEGYPDPAKFGVQQAARFDEVGGVKYPPPMPGEVVPVGGVGPRRKWGAQNTPVQW